MATKNITLKEMMSGEFSLGQVNGRIRVYDTKGSSQTTTFYPDNIKWKKIDGSSLYAISFDTRYSDKTPRYTINAKIDEDLEFIECATNKQILIKLFRHVSPGS